MACKRRLIFAQGRIRGILLYILAQKTDVFLPVLIYALSSMSMALPPFQPSNTLRYFRNRAALLSDSPIVRKTH